MLLQHRTRQLDPGTETGAELTKAGFAAVNMPEDAHVHVIYALRRRRHRGPDKPAAARLSKVKICDLRSALGSKRARSETAVRREATTTPVSAYMLLAGCLHMKAGNLTSAGRTDLSRHLTYGIANARLMAKV